MMSWAVTFLIIALIAGILGLTGIAGVAMNIAWLVLVVGLILAIIYLLTGSRPPL